MMDTDYNIAEGTADMMRNGLYYGMVIMAIVFSFVFYLIFRDRRFTIYALLQMSLLSIFAYEDGTLDYIFSGQGGGRHYLVWNIAICSTLANWFTYYFLDVKDRFPWFKPVAITLIAALFGSVSLYIWTEIPVFRTMVSIFCYLLPGMGLYVAMRIFRDNVYARFLLLTFGVLVLAGGLLTLNNYIDSPWLYLFDVNMIRLVSTLEIIAISFVLIYKVRTLREENVYYKSELRYHLKLLEAGKSAGKTSEAKLVLLDIERQYQLTEREKEVLMLIWDGASNQEISERLNISVNTTKYHISNLYTKLEIKSRSEARMFRPVMA